MNIPENSNTKRISIDLPEDLISRFDQLRKEWGLRARGPVIEKLLKELLQEDDFLPKNQQQEIDFNDNNEKLNIDEDTALVLIKSDVKKEVNEISLNKRVSNNNQNKEKKSFYQHKKLEMLNYIKDSLERKIASVTASIEVLESQINRDNEV